MERIKLISDVHDVPEDSQKSIKEITLWNKIIYKQAVKISEQNIIPMNNHLLELIKLKASGVNR